MVNVYVILSGVVDIVAVVSVYVAFSDLVLFCVCVGGVGGGGGVNAQTGDQ